MEIAAIENEQIPSPHIYKHNPIHLIYMIISTICFLIEVYQRISIDLFYSSYTNINIHVPSFNRYLTEFTASYRTISYIWYLVFIWQAIWIIYSFFGLFRRTSLGFYFYQYPCAMNEWAFFYITIALLFYITQLTDSANNRYFIAISIIRYVFASCSIIFVFIMVNTAFEDNMRDYLRDGYFVDIWLTRLFYQNGLALWASILFYECCLSIIIALIYLNLASLSTASFIGIFIFLTGIILLGIYEYYDHKDTLAFTLLHWFVFFWIIMDIVFIKSKQKIHTSSTFNGIIIFSIPYLIILFIINRIRILYTVYKENIFPTFQSRKVYSLVVPPRLF